MEYRVLGPLEVIQNGESLNLGPKKQRSVLALLLMNANRVVSSDQIIEQIWAGEPERENVMWVAISRLRAILEPDRKRGEHTILVTQNPGYRLAVAEGEVDADLFATEVAEADSLLRGDPIAAEKLSFALGLWRGPPYQDFEYDDFAQVHIGRLQELHLYATELRMEADLRAGKASDLVAELEGLASANPFRESLVDKQMRALYQAGRQVEALRVFERFKQFVGEETGLEPSPELARLEEQLLLHDDAVRPRHTAAQSVDVVNPYQGLRVFREEDADRFFGRDRVVSQVVQRLVDGDTLVGLVGASGSGKSSIVRAGVIPALRKGAVSGSDGWLVASMTPGSHPFDELEAALLHSSLDAPENLAEQLRGEHGDDLGILRAVMRVLPREDTRLLLLIDQAEELFTLVESEDVRRRFLDELTTAMEDKRGRLVVVMTLRADFYDRPLAYPQFGEMLGQHVINVVPMLPHELEVAAVTPASRSGAAFEPSLLAALISDVVGHAGTLPLFQYTLTELFDRRVDRVLSLNSYEEMGGVTGALSVRAEDIYAALDDEQRWVSRQVFLRLVSIAETGERTRRRTKAGEILTLGIDVAVLQAVIEAFGSTRLLTFHRDQLSGAPTVEVAHEALLDGWARLRRWIDEAADDIRRHARLSSLTKEWIEADRDESFLLSGGRLENAAALAESSTLSLAAPEQSFLSASLAARADLEQEQLAREAQAEKLERSAKRRASGLIAAGLALAAVAIVALIIALRPEPPVVGVVSDSATVGPRDLQIQAALDPLAQRGQASIEYLFPTTDAAAELASFMADVEPEILLLSLVDPTFESLYGISVADFQALHPDVTLLATDARGVSFDESVTAWLQEDGAFGGFLAGVVAADRSESNVIGYISADGGTERWRTGFETGAQAVRPSIQIVSTYLLGGPFDRYTDSTLSTEAAHRLIDDGADVIFAAAGDGSLGIFDAAAARSSSTQQIWGIGVDVNASLLSEGPGDHVLTSVVRRRDVMSSLMIEKALANELLPGPFPAPDDISFWDLPETGTNLDDDARSSALAILGRLSAGEFSIPDAPSAPATHDPPADHQFEVAINDESCELEGLIEAQQGDVVRLIGKNDSSRVRWLVSWSLLPGTDPQEAAAAGFPPELDRYERIFPFNSVSIAPGGSNALVTDLVEAGPWAIACWDVEDDRFFDGTFQFASGFDAGAS